VRAATVTPLITGLNAPRGVAFDGQGSLYVSESGKAGPGPFGLTRTGRVSKYAWGRRPVLADVVRILYATVDPTQPPDHLGPEGISAVGNAV